VSDDHCEALGRHGADQTLAVAALLTRRRPRRRAEPGPRAGAAKKSRLRGPSKGPDAEQYKPLFVAAAGRLEQEVDENPTGLERPVATVARTRRT
jgi:hypothetical protein